ncbi:abdominal ganglion neuropeptide L11-like, partial [Physella acuta]|uniref:abdominal ganglion neuropeptide L11-like n=1 Tax=Physella acuta TaxID=109671 RepID=UPI0027DCDEAB
KMCPINLLKIFIITLVTLEVNGFILPKRSRSIDCKKYVFAPRCRGVSAKRAIPQSTNVQPSLPESSQLDAAVLKSFLSARNQELDNTSRFLEFLQQLQQQTNGDRRKRMAQHSRALNIGNEGDKILSLLASRVSSPGL